MSTENDGSGAKHQITQNAQGETLQDRLERLEKVLSNSGFVELFERHATPSWRRVSQGEHRLPVATAVILAIALQLVLPSNLTFHPTYLLPSLEGLLLVGVTVANPRRINRTSIALRASSIALIALISAANAWSTGELIKGLVNGTAGNNAALLLTRGASIYLTNILVFGLWYWEWDRGGPVARARGTKAFPDFLFPQMAQPDLAPPQWTPTFIDYLYVSFTNAAAFSPTDTMPLSRWAKMLMLLQSAMAILTVAFVIARAVNILK